MYEIERSYLDIAEDWDLEIHAAYSGRFMYGKTCFGVVGSITDLLGFIAALAIKLNDDNMADVMFDCIVQDVRTDNMGYDTIFYFPSLSVVD
jgi:hypothetical protein